MGKSTLMKVLYRRALNEKKFLPILVDLRRLDGSKSLEVVLADQFGLKAKHLDLFADFLTTQPLLFLFDGFDEVTEGRKTEVARTLRHFIDRTDRARFLITSRPDIPFSEYTDFYSFHIKELTKEQSYALITKYGAAYGIEDRARALLEELKAKHSGPVESFLKNPLLTSLLFRAFEYKSVIPVKRGVFYRQVFDALYESHDLSKETGYVREKRTGLHHDDFHRALRALAKLFRQARKVEVTVDDFLDMSKEISKSLCPDLAFAPEAMLHDVVHAVPLFFKDGNLIRWAHKSLLDHFLCEFLLRDYPDSREEALARAAAGLNARTNENFLILVQEADPILFAKAVSIPAIDTLLKRHEEIRTQLPSGISAEVAQDICDIFMNHDVLLSKNTDEVVEEWIRRNDPVTNADIKWADLLPVALFQYGDHVGLSIFAMVSTVALKAPFDLGVIPSTTGHSITRKYDLVPPDDVTPKKKGVKAFIGSRRSKKDWDEIEDEFTTIAGMLRSVDMRFATSAMLKRSKQELEKLVSSSLQARSNDVF